VSKIETGRWSEQLRRMLGQKGQEMTAAELSPEVTPTIQIEGEAAEWRFLKAVRDVSSGADLIGVAGNKGRFRLRNPTNSGVIAQVNYLEQTSESTGVHLAARGTETTDLALSTVASTVLDQRWQAGSGAQTGALIFSVTNLDVLEPEGRVFMRILRLGRTPWRLAQQVVLTPGTNLDWGIQALNIRVVTSLGWQERQLPSLEL